MNKILLFIVLILFLGFAFNLFGLGTVLSGANKMSCSNAGGGTWSCNLDGLGDLPASSGKFNLAITKPSRGDEYGSLLCSTLSAISFESCRPQGATEPNSRYIGYQSGLFRDIAGTKQFIRLPVIDEKGAVSIATGYCDVTAKKCTVDNPNPNADKLTAQGINIYFKKGGYLEADACNEFSLDCPEEIKDIIELPPHTPNPSTPPPEESNFIIKFWEWILSWFS